jgi:hypothetical protein
MLRLLADENFHGAIINGVRRRVPEVDVVRVQDTDIAGADDAAVLPGRLSKGGSSSRTTFARCFPATAGRR